MSTLISPPYSPTSLEIRGYLHQIGHQLLETDTPLLSKRPLPVELQQLEKLNQTLTAHARAHFDRCRALYADVAQADLQSDEGKQRLATLRRDLTAHLRSERPKLSWQKRLKRIHYRRLDSHSKWLSYRGPFRHALYT